MAPLIVVPLPAHCQQPVHFLSPAARLIPHDSHVGHHAEREKEGARGEIRSDRENVPRERRAEVGPESAEIRYGQDPVSNPDASKVYEGKQSGCCEAEDCDSFGAAVDSCTPFNAEEKEDRGDQRARVRDTDPEHECRNVHRPSDRVIFSRFSNPVRNLDTPGISAGTNQQEEDGQ